MPERPCASWRCEMKFRNLILLALIAAFCFGGTFTCKSGNTTVHKNNDED